MTVSGATADAEFVAVTKYGVAACADAGISHRIIDDYYPAEELIALALEDYDRLERACAAWDRVVFTEAPEAARRGIRVFGHSLYELKILMDTVGTKLFQLRALLDRTDGAELWYRDDQFPAPLGDDLAFPDSANLFAPALAALAESDPTISSRLRPVRMPRPSLPSLMRRMTASRIVGAILRRLRALRSGSTRKRSFLLFDLGHDIEPLLPYLRARGLEPLRWETGGTLPDRAATTAFEQAWKALTSDSAFSNFFTAGGASYLPLVASRLRHLVTQTAPAAMSAYDQAAARLGGPSSRPEFALTAVVTVGLVGRARMKAAQDAGLRLIGYQEGAGFGSVEHPMNDYAEVPDGDAFLCYGAGNVAYRERLVARGRPAKPFIAVGSAEQDRIRTRVMSRTPPEQVLCVAYVGNNPRPNRQHHPFNVFTDTAYHRSQRVLFETLLRAPLEVAVRVKPHPGDALTPAFFGRRSNRPVKILDGWLEDCLDGVDLFIIDFPSTVLLTCCQTRAHLFVLAEPGSARFSAEALAALSRRAEIFPDPAALTARLDEVLSGRATLEPRDDDSYSRLFATHLGDGRSAERAAAYLDDAGRLPPLETD